jgi:hypothetical protein
MTHPEPAHDLDPLEAVEAATVEEYDDPTPDEVTDPNDPNFVEPAEDVTA